MRPRLLVISGLLTGTVKPLVDGQISIGRDESNQLCLNETAVSRKHCRIERLDGQHQVVDLGSHNGTFVNGIPIGHKQIEHGDTIRIGKSELVFLVHEGEIVSNSSIFLGHSVSADSLTTMRLDHPAVLPTFGVEVGRMARDLATLFRISNVINSIRESKQLQREVLRLIFEVIPAEHGAVVLLSDVDDDELGSICTWSRQPGAEKPIELQRQLVQRAVWERSAVFTNSTSDSSETENVLCVPLVAVERTIGVIYLTSPRSAPSFREDHIHFLSSVSRITAVTLENILALDALRSENRRLTAEIDPNQQTRWGKAAR